ncbi:MAG: hypothetical protein A2951_01660 [Candidatus Buchananbacteria bacterium RIFCSPLOWO2_01_FULL_56_15]|uniref:Uncharacterized protein n=2 Tax=Candidatus Buchananiibacteriota TaxID=1817903 RepID=A0A1G1YHJ8_9BACT|nr:MAG: hypothetical protein A3J59_03680 [Candidatus Buchananbacteria bacterium RIFCSPHIGHO2_02_FULL_56_16]OGY55277.1 MAG: hypothetical protein A2951_01660 [Candidatus Buchananbacteria bacterium RIFCSPLOWO2_01_FULL_56_15]
MIISNKVMDAGRLFVRLKAALRPGRSIAMAGSVAGLTLKLLIWLLVDLVLVATIVVAVWWIICNPFGCVQTFIVCLMAGAMLRRAHFYCR